MREGGGREGEGPGVTLYLGCSRLGLKPGFIEFLITWAQVLKDSACQLRVLRYCVQCSGVNTVLSFVIAFVFSRKSLEPH